MNQNTERVTQEKDLWDTLKLVKSLFNKGISQIYFIFKFTILFQSTQDDMILSKSNSIVNLNIQ